MTANAAFCKNGLARPSVDLIRISNRLAAIQSILFAEYGVATIHIGAGSSLAILDHCLEGKELVMRDLDVFVCLGSEMTEAIAFEMGRKLQSPEAGRFSEHDVRPRRRANPDLPLPEAFNYNAGFGFFLIDDRDAILDLTVFHTHDDLLLNGIMNIDKVRIRLDHRVALVEQLAPLFDSTAPDFQAAGIDDPHGGYRSWQAGTAELANEFDVRRAPLQTILRIIRSFAKFSVPSISKATRDQLGRLLDGSDDDSVAFHTIRGLIKMLSDRNAVWELKLLRELGGLKKIGGIARQKLEQLFHVFDRSDCASDVVDGMLRSTASQLAQVEHQMKLQGSF